MLATIAETLACTHACTVMYSVSVPTGLVMPPEERREQDDAGRREFHTRAR